MSKSFWKHYRNRITSEKQFEKDTTSELSRAFSEVVKIGWKKNYPNPKFISFNSCSGWNNNCWTFFSDSRSHQIIGQSCKTQLAFGSFR